MTPGSPLQVPFGFRPLAVIGVLTNVLYLLFVLVSIVWNTFGGPQDSVPEYIRANALEFQSNLFYLPLSLIGIIISIGLIRKNIRSLRHLKYLLIGSIAFDASYGITEAKFSLDGSSGGAADLLVASLGILLNSLIYAYWDRSVIVNYMKACANTGESVETFSIQNRQEQSYSKYLLASAFVLLVSSLLLTIGYLMAAWSNASDIFVGLLFLIQVFVCLLSVVFAFFSAFKQPRRRILAMVIGIAASINMIFSLVVFVIGVLSGG